MQDQPNPDAILANLKEGSLFQGARLKVFLGMCPGVGKTYTMLQVARQLSREGVDLVIGLVETHGRRDTEALLDGLEIIPRQKITYRGVTLEELDIDAILKRRPQWVIVDELAHTNASGSRHPKRYQDVLELLDAGISVFTTLNIQHIESRVDIVRQITGVTVHETVPDSVLDRADEFQLVDLTPEELRNRLEEGKVYLGNRAEVAAENFFKIENLTALREMALRFAAERADLEMREAMRERKISGPWKSTERLMVGVGPSPYSESLIRWTRRMAGALDCPWVAVYVESDLPLESSAKDRVTRHLSLARQLGAEVIITSGYDISEALLQIAKEQNVTQIIVGKPVQSGWWSWFKRGTLVRRLMRRSGPIDLYIVQPEKHLPLSKKVPSSKQTVFPGNEFFLIGVSTVLVTGVCLFVAPFTGYSTIALIYLLLVVNLSMKLSRWPVLITAAVSAILWNFLFVPPRFTFYIQRLDDAMMFGMFFIVAIAMGSLTSRLRLKEMVERKREQRMEALYEMAQQAALAPDLDTGLQAALRLIESLLNVECALFLRLPNHLLSTDAHPASSWVLSEKEKSVSDWAFSRRVNAGKFTDTLPDSEALHLPLTARTAIMGVLSIRPIAGKTFDLTERELLDAFSGLIASILEKDHFIQAFKHAEVYEISERLKRALLDSVSHELKTPLAAVQAGVESLVQEKSSAKSGTRESAVHEIRIALERLHRIINNLLDMSRIQAGVVKPKLEWCDIEEVVQAAIDLAGDILKDCHIVTEVEKNMPLVRLDHALIEQSLYNLLINAAFWGKTPAKTGANITIRASIHDGKLVISILDEGTGIRTSDIEHVFKKFYRATDSKTGGTGLGLSIVQGFVQAHGGTVAARNRATSGAEFEMIIPVETMEKDQVKAVL